MEESIKLEGGIQPGESIKPEGDIQPGEGIQPEEGIQPGEDIEPGEGIQPEESKEQGESRESWGLLERIKVVFDCQETDVRAYSPLTLAYIGDAVYDLVIRSVVVERANRSANELHKKTIKYVKAEAQAAMIMALIEELTPEEDTVYKRGRNAKSHTAAKNASLADYRKATGYEALLGYLYLLGRTDRVLYLIHRGITLAGMSL